MTDRPVVEPLPELQSAIPTADEEPTPVLEFTPERKFELYLQQRKDYSDGARDAYQRFDQTIVALSGGSIVLSITFLKDIGHTPESLPWLFRSWGCFLFASLCAFISLLTSGEYHRKQLQELDCLMANGHCKEPRVLSWITARLNFVALFFCILGVALIIVFSRLNLAEGSSTWQKAANQAPAAKSAPVTASSAPVNQATQSLSPAVSSAAAPAATAAQKPATSATQTQPTQATQSQHP
ncbi:MAG: hypothetical protein QOC81_5017 [Thermoanaerobaculia bacterium]|jgi:hypothetical protein|nr:hypothetical protein [Thermoanaerobaculia bacterium]